MRRRAHHYVAAFLFDNAGCSNKVRGEFLTYMNIVSMVLRHRATELYMRMRRQGSISPVDVAALLLYAGYLRVRRNGAIFISGTPLDTLAKQISISSNGATEECMENVRQFIEKAKERLDELTGKKNVKRYYRRYRRRKGRGRKTTASDAIEEKKI